MDSVVLSCIISSWSGTVIGFRWRMATDSISLTKMAVVFLLVLIHFDRFTKEFDADTEKYEGTRLGPL